MLDMNMQAQVGQKSQSEARQWSQPKFTRLGGLAHVRGICGPDHLPNNPYCPPS